MGSVRRGIVIGELGDAWGPLANQHQSDHQYVQVEGIQVESVTTR
jgi:hypothetical protein